MKNQYKIKFTDIKSDVNDFGTTQAVYQIEADVLTGPWTWESISLTYHDQGNNAEYEAYLSDIDDSWPVELQDAIVDLITENFDNIECGRIYDLNAPFAKSQCYSYSIRDLKADYKNTWRSGWIEARDLMDALRKVSKQYDMPCSTHRFKDGKQDQVIKLSWQGNWESFKKINDRLGWD